ncbi:beta-glucosidase [Leptodontidium sp. 2 PMI_412]|nr:beta-glucosidase [Leptodontidium sp. 2 PMI_412]
MSSRTSQPIARQACDPCRVRKRKCDTGSSSAQSPNANHGRSLGPGEIIQQCKRCAELGLPCTFLLPVATRGPRKKNRFPASTTSNSSEPSTRRVSVLEALHSPDLSRETMASPRATISPSNPPIVTRESVEALSPFRNQTSPRSVFSAHSASPRFNGTFPTDSLCSRPLLNRIMSDYLDHLYPLIPIVHRPTFRADLEKGKDLYDNDFLALMLSISAATVGTIPRKFNEYRNAPNPLRFKTRTEMINHCYDMTLGLRGSDYFDEINFNKWASSYFMQIAFFQIGQHNRQRMVEVEAMQLARLLDLHQISSYDGLDCIQTQLRKKGFWLMFYGYVHSQLQNLRKERLTYLDGTILSTIDLEDLMPVEVDDEMIHEDFVQPQPEKHLSLVTGFNVASRIFWASLIPLSTQGSAGAKDQYCNCVRSRKPDIQLAYLQDRMHDLKYMLDGLPTQLRQWATVRDDEGLDGLDTQQRKILHSQYESTRANIHVSHLWLQSIIADQIDALRERELNGSQADLVPSTAKDRWPEREDTCRQLLHILHGIPEIHLEPNGHHLTYKVRDVAVTLLACPFDSQHEVAKRAFGYLREFTDILSRLDGSETINTLSLQSWVDTGRKIGKAG